MKATKEIVVAETRRRTEKRRDKEEKPS